MKYLITLFIIVISSSPFLGPNFSLRIFLSSIRDERFFRVFDQVSHPNKTNGKVIILYTIIARLLGRTQEDKII
jgi:hypothetical protein